MKAKKTTNIKYWGSEERFKHLVSNKDKKAQKGSKKKGVPGPGTYNINTNWNRDEKTKKDQHILHKIS